MKRNMLNWIKETIDEKRKLPMPVLSFPAIQLMDITVKDLISSSDVQARGMVEIAKRVKASGSVSLMDLSLEAECFGSEIVVSDDEVPTVKGSIVATQEDADALKIPKVGDCRTGIYVDAVRKAALEITDRPVFGGVIGPFSLAGRLMDVTEAMIYCYTDPDMVHTVLEKCTEFLIEYMLAYKEAGANGIMMAEPLAGLLSPELAEQFSCKYVKRIIDAIEDENFIVVYHNCGNNTIQMIDEILATGARVLHFGNAIDMAEMMQHIPADIIAMGNVSPADEFRNGTPESTRKATLELMEQCTGYPNFVPSSGCDIPPVSPWENIDAFFAAVDEYYNRESVEEAV